MPGCLWASASKAYVAFGWVLSAFWFSFFLILWWLFAQFRGVGFWQIVLYAMSIALIFPCRFTYIDGAAFPNWVVRDAGGEVSFISNFLIFLVNTFIFLGTRTRQPLSPARGRPRDSTHT